MKKTFLKAAIPTLAMLLVAIMALTGTTYAWFTETKKANVNGITVNIDSAGGLKISTDSGSTWLSTIDMAATLDNFKPCSTNLVAKTGATLDFYTAKVGNDQTKITNLQPATTEYYTFDVWVKNDSSTDMPFDFGITKIDGDGKIAARMAILNIDSSAVILKYASSDVTTYGLNGTAFGATEVAETSGSHVTEYTTSATTNTVGETIPANGILKYRVFIWLEGQDSDCVNSITSKQFTVSIEFDAE